MEADINSSWIYIPKHYLKNTEILEIIQHINSHKITKLRPFEKIPPFYKQVIEGYIQCNMLHNSQCVDVMEMCIWGNRHITNKTGEVLYFPYWIKSGIVQIKNINIIEGKIDENYIFTKLTHKFNYLSEVYQVKHGLHS